MIQCVLTPMNLLKFSSPILFNHIHFGCRSGAHELYNGNSLQNPRTENFKLWKRSLIGDALWSSTTMGCRMESFGFACAVYCSVNCFTGSSLNNSLNKLSKPSYLKLNTWILIYFQLAKAWELLSYPHLLVSTYLPSFFKGFQFECSFRKIGTGTNIWNYKLENVQYSPILFPNNLG